MITIVLPFWIAYILGVLAIMAIISIGLSIYEQYYCWRGRRHHDN